MHNWFEMATSILETEFEFASTIESTAHWTEKHNQGGITLLTSPRPETKFPVAKISVELNAASRTVFQ